jgi:hypothetical protein
MVETMEGRGVKEANWCSWRRKEEKLKVKRKKKKNYIRNLPRTT